MSTEAHCFHCQDVVIGKPFVYADKVFCCKGCMSVYQLLSESELGQFYVFEQGAGVKPSSHRQQHFAFLDLSEIRKKHISFEDESLAQVVLFLPGIHCSSCIYLLEHLNKLDARIRSCQVNFIKRDATILFESQTMQLSDLALLLSKIGYTPNFGARQPQDIQSTKRYLYKLGVAAFAFGSIMLWSFPEYVGIASDNPEFRNLTSLLSLLVSIPVLLYSANDYFVSAWKALRHKVLNLDVPISIGIVALYAQSCYSILSGQGPGYMDSFAGFIFFLLIGKWFQSKTYRSLAFDRDYTSYFPLAVERLNADGSDELVSVEQLVPGDRICIRNEEVIPCDVCLESDEALVDYSFISGESHPVKKQKGDFIYAGARLTDSMRTFRVEKESSRSHLTQLWDQSSGATAKATRSDQLARYFLIFLLLIASVSGITWLFISPSRSIEIVVAVLIVACPCALALSRPFTYGNVMRLLGRKGLYLKNSSVIEDLRSIDTIVFDKTGTLTTVAGKLSFEGGALTADEVALIYTAVGSSTHPYSREIAKYLMNCSFKMTPRDFDHFSEERGKGIELRSSFGNLYVGSAAFTGAKSEDTRPSVYIRLNDRHLGRFVFRSDLRPELHEMLKQLHSFDLHLLSGDNDGDLELMRSVFPPNSTLNFGQTPGSKQEYILGLQKTGKKVLMIGDGLNDASALKAANVGISISDDIFQFTPASDAIIDGRALHQLPLLLGISKHSKTILRTCLLFSILYNSIGLGFAVTGYLSPLVAAILMPLSSITVVFIATFGTLFFSPKEASL